jgi:hypothetical protein
MEPIEIPEEARLLMPEHELVTLAKDQPQYRPLPILRLVGDPDGRVYSMWSLNDDERKRIAEGEPIVIEQLTFNRACKCRGFMPILPTVGLQERCPADPVIES